MRCFLLKIMNEINKAVQQGGLAGRISAQDEFLRKRSACKAAFGINRAGSPVFHEQEKIALSFFNYASRILDQNFLKPILLIEPYPKLADHLIDLFYANGVFALYAKNKKEALQIWDEWAGLITVALVEASSGQFLGTGAFDSLEIVESIKRFPGKQPDIKVMDNFQVNLEIIKGEIVTKNHFLPLVKEAITLARR